MHKLTHPRFPTEDWAASYAPDGRRIVFTSDRGRADRFFSGTDLYTMDSNGSHIHRIPLPASIQYPDSAQWGTALLQATGVAPSSSARPTSGRPPAFCASEGARLAVPVCLWQQSRRIDPIALP